VESDSIRVITYLPEALADCWWKDKYLLCLVPLAVHHHAGYSRPGLAQHEANVYVRIILVQVCCNCFFYEDEAEEIRDSIYTPSVSCHQLRTKPSGRYIMMRMGISVIQSPDEKDIDSFRNVGLIT
jgi:hypothetical protein